MKTICLLSLIFAHQLLAQATATSIIQVIANPKDFDGRVVRFEGATNIEFEGNAIYMSKEQWKAQVASFGIWMDVSDELTRSKRWLNGKYCIVEGTFHANNRGHMGLFMGSLSDITLFHQREPISPAEIKRLQRQAEQAAQLNSDWTQPPPELKRSSIFFQMNIMDSSVIAELVALKSAS